MQHSEGENRRRKYFRYLLVLFLTLVLIGTNIFGFVPDNGFSNQVRAYFSLLLPPESVGALNAGLNEYGFPTLPSWPGPTSGNGYYTNLDLVGILPGLINLVFPRNATLSPPTPSPVATISLTETSTSTETSTLTRTSTTTETTTSTHTPGEFFFTPELNLACHSGPGIEYNQVQVAEAGEPYLLDGRNEEGTWYRIMITSATGCWVIASQGATSGDASGIRIILSPTLTPTPPAQNGPTSTPTIDLTVQ